MHISPLWCQECWTQAEDLKAVSQLGQMLTSSILNR